MRSWKSPALLATVGLCGLGSLFAQGPLLPTPADPMVVDGPVPPSSTPMESYAPTATPIPMGTSSLSHDSHIHEGMSSPVMAGSEVIVSQPSAYHDSSVVHSAPVESASEPCCLSEVSAPPPMVESSVVYSTPIVTQAVTEMPQPGCGCQGGSGRWSNHSMHAGGAMYGRVSVSTGFGHGHVYGQGPSPSYLLGSGSGVGSGLLSPNANSGGLHTRYPYYNYRHPWYYQGPPSQNVTIVW